MTKVHHISIQHKAVAVQPSPPPGNPSLWKVVEQACGPVLCWRSQSLTVLWNSAEEALKGPSLSDWRSCLSFSNLHEVTLADDVNMLTLQVRRRGPGGDLLAQLARERLSLGSYAGVSDLWFSRQASFSFSKDVGENEKVLLKETLVKVIGLGAKSGVFDPAVEEARVIGPGDEILWHRPRPRLIYDEDSFRNALASSLNDGSWSKLRKNYRVIEKKWKALHSDHEEVRTPIKQLSRIDRSIDENFLASERSKASFEAPVSFLVSLPKLGDSYSNQDKFRFRCESWASQMDRSMGTVTFRPSNNGIAVFEAWSSLPLNQRGNQKDILPGSVAVCMGPWDSRNPLQERRVECAARDFFYVKRDLDFKFQGEILGGDQDWVSYVCQNLLRQQSGLQLNYENFSNFMSLNSVRVDCERVWMHWVAPADVEELLDSCRRFHVPAALLATKTSEIDVVCNSQLGQAFVISPLELSGVNIQRDEISEVVWSYPDVRSPLYGFDRVALFPDDYLMRVAARDPFEQSWTHQLKRNYSGDRFRSPLLRNTACVPLDAFKWTDGDHTWVESFGVQRAWTEIDPRQSGIACLDLAIRNLVSLGADPKMAGASVWLSSVPEESVLDNSSLAASCLLLDGLVTAASNYGIKFSFIQSNGSSSTSSTPEMYVALRAKVKESGMSVSPGFRMSGEQLYAIGPKSAFVDAGSKILAQIPRIQSTHISKLDAYQQQSFYDLVLSLIKKGMVSSIRPVGEGGIALAVAEMSLWGRIGAQLRPSLTPIELFSGSPGRFVVGVLPQDVKNFEALIKSEYLMQLGSTGGEKVLGLPLERLIKAREGQL